MSYPMTATLRNIEPPAANESFTPEQFSREEAMIVEPASGPPLDADDMPDRRLRNRIIIANAAVWIVIIVMIRLVFF